MSHKIAPGRTGEANQFGDRYLSSYLWTRLQSHLPRPASNVSLYGHLVAPNLITAWCGGLDRTGIRGPVYNNRPAVIGILTDTMAIRKRSKKNRRLINLESRPVPPFGATIYLVLDNFNPLLAAFFLLVLRCNYRLPRRHNQSKSCNGRDHACSHSSNPSLSRYSMLSRRPLLENYSFYSIQFVCSS